MNHYTLAEMTPGLTEEFTVTVTPEMMDAFRAITGDVSPIHIDADYARGRGFPGKRAQRSASFSRSPQPWASTSVSAGAFCSSRSISARPTSLVAPVIK